MKNLMFQLLLWLPAVSQAQQLEVLSTGGMQLSGKGLSITASIGEVFLSVPSAGASYATGGFQQGFLPEMTTAFREAQTPVSSMEASLFPNPATDRVQVSILNPQARELQLSLFNAQGMLLASAPCFSEAYSFDLKALAAGQYWISVQSAGAAKPILLPFHKINP